MHPSHDDARLRKVDTPFGHREITEKLWNKGTDSEKWQAIQTVGVDGSQDEHSSGSVLRHLLESYSVAYQLVGCGYGSPEVVDEGTIIWTKENSQ